MTITEISATVSRTIGLPNFGSIKVGGSLTATLENGDDIAAVRAELHRELKAMMTEQWNTFRRQVE